MSRAIRRYVEEKSQLEYDRGYTEAELKASKLRKDFFRKYIVEFDPYFYSTQEEKDWAYIAKREYRYDVVLRSLADSWALSAAASIIRMYQTKRLSVLPYFIVWPIAYLYFQPIKFQRHNKKLFDMCNLGDEYTLGRERNKVLEQCNEILDREDF